MNEIRTQDTPAETADAAAVQLGLNKETLRDLDAPAAGDDAVQGGFLMRDTVIVPTGIIMKDSVIVRPTGF